MRKTPGKPRKRSRGDGAATELAILEAAVRLFALHGYEAVSLQTIAEAIKVTAPTVYLYFKDKHSLYVAAVIHCLSRSTGRILAAANEGATPQARLKNYIHALSRGLIEDQIDLPKISHKDTPQGSASPDPLATHHRNFEIVLRTSHGEEKVTGELLHSSIITYQPVMEEVIGTAFGVPGGLQMCDAGARVRCGDEAGVGLYELSHRIEALKAPG